MFGTHGGTGGFSARQRRAMGLAVVVQLTLLVAAQIDLLRRPQTAVRGSKWAWRAATFVNFVGPLAYFAFGRRSGSDTPGVDSRAAVEPSGATTLA